MGIYYVNIIYHLLIISIKYKNEGTDNKTCLYVGLLDQFCKQLLLKVTKDFSIASVTQFCT